MKQLRRCEICNTDFEADVREINRGNARFCSRSCSAKRSRKDKTPNTECATCKKPLYRMPQKMTRNVSGLSFCSQACLSRAKRIGGIESVQATPYRGQDAPHFYRDCAAVRERLVACEQCSYKTHPEILQVHHIDHDRSNNAMSNLKILCPTCHMETHFLLGTGFWTGRGFDAQG